MPSSVLSSLPLLVLTLDAGPHWDEISPAAKDLLRKLTSPDPFQRITAAQAAPDRGRTLWFQGQFLLRLAVRRRLSSTSGAWRQCQPPL